MKIGGGGQSYHPDEDENAKSTFKSKTKIFTLFNCTANYLITFCFTFRENKNLAVKNTGNSYKDARKKSAKRNMRVPRVAQPGCEC